MARPRKTHAQHINKTGGIIVWTGKQSGAPVKRLQPREEGGGRGGGVDFEEQEVAEREGGGG